MKITVAGIGPGGHDYVLPIVHAALAAAEVVVGYGYYIDLVDTLLPPGAERVAMPLGTELARAQRAIACALSGRDVLVISSGDAGVYAMASIVHEEVARQGHKDIVVETLPGLSAFSAAASRLGAPLGHDFCCISLSDLHTPWERIERRIMAAAAGDFVINIYNPVSQQRYWQLKRLQQCVLPHRDPTTPVAVCRQLTRSDESIQITTLAGLNEVEVDMFCIVVIGNTQTFRYQDRLITPRGYYDTKPKTGEAIQHASFMRIAEVLRGKKGTAWEKWVHTRVIHTTGDVRDTDLVETTTPTLRQWHAYVMGGGAIVTDVTMVQAGIGRAYCAQYGNMVHCYLHTPEAMAVAEESELTQSQAAMRVAIAAHPTALFVVGNAPTALMELTETLRRDNTFRPAGIIAAVVGFVNVIEAKAQLAHLPTSVPSAIVRGNRGGSNVAAAIVNAIFSLGQATTYYPDDVH